MSVFYWRLERASRANVPAQWLSCTFAALCTCAGQPANGTPRRVEGICIREEEGGGRQQCSRTETCRVVPPLVSPKTPNTSLAAAGQRITRTNKNGRIHHKSSHQTPTDPPRRTLITPNRTPIHSPSLLNRPETKKLHVTNRTPSETAPVSVTKKNRSRSS